MLKGVVTVDKVISEKFVTASCPAVVQYPKQHNFTQCTHYCSVYEVEKHRELLSRACGLIVSEL